MGVMSPLKYDDDFRAGAVSLVLDKGMTQKQVQADLGVSHSALSRWVTDARLKARGMEPCDDPAKRRDLVVALKRIEELELENEILRKASAYLSQANVRYPK